MNQVRRFVSTRSTLGALALMLASQAHAAVDVAAAVTGIADAGAAILLIIGALLALSISIFGLSKAYAFVKSKAGA